MSAKPEFFRSLCEPLNRLLSIVSGNRETTLATAQGFGPAAISKDVNRRETRAEAESIWSRASTWGLLLLLIYFALDGVSPFVNEPIATRAVATGSAGGVLMERLGKLLICAACMVFAVQRHQSVRR